MPTTKPPYTVTDTGDLSDQLDEAQRRRPEIRDRKELLLLKLAAALLSELKCRILMEVATNAASRHRPPPSG